MNFDTEKELRKMRETHITTVEIFNGKVLHVQKDEVRLPDGNSSEREIIRHIGAVCVIPVTENNEAVMERQYRYAIDSVILEIPAGKLDAADEDRLSAVQRELREETGYTAEEWIPLGGLYCAPAYSDEYITMYLARGLHRGESDPDEDEFLEVSLIPLSELVKEVMDGHIRDAKTQICVLKAARFLGM